MMRTLAASAALLCLLAVVARAEDYVVIESTVPSVQAGATIASATPLDVPAKGRIVLVAASGQVVTVNGPFQGPPPAASGGTPADASMLKILPTLLGQNDQRQTPGVVRGTDIAWRADSAKSLGDVLAINATDGGDVCLYDASQAEVTHNPSNTGTMTIHAMSGDDSASLDWQKGALRQKWPTKLPLADGSVYLFEQSGQDAAAVATIHILKPGAAASDVARVTEMARAGCNDQAKLLLAMIAKSAK